MASPIREVHLDNGLKVVLKEVHSAPVTSTWMWYRVGSRNEVEGYTGISHWVEHMMFKGSSQFPKGSIMREVDRRGGHVNAMTSSDFTAYYMTLPGDRAELALRIEADRMTTALFDPQEAEAERTVIIAEREGSENEPRFVLAEDVMATAFRIHPYRHQIIGWKEDLLHLTRDQLYAHYQRYYAPNNAVLVVVGDFDSGEYLSLIERYFAAIPSGPVPDQTVRTEPPQRGERRVILRMPGSTPILRLVYHTPPVSHPDYIPLVVLDSVLSGGKAMFAFGGSPTRSARLYRTLVETELASSAGSQYHPTLDPYVLSVGVTVREGRQPDQVEQAVLAEMDRLKNEPIESGELAVAIRQTQAQFAYASESVTDQALTLGFLDMVADYRRMDRVLDELAQVTPEEVQRVARTYLDEDNRVVGWFLPTNEGGGAAGEGEETSEALPNGLCYYTSGPRPLAISPESVIRTQLDNGITLLIKENPASPTVTIAGDMIAGGTHEDDSTVGLASLTASMLRRGTSRRNYQELNMALDSVGASLGLSAGRDDMGFDIQALADDFDLVIELLAEVLMEPSFPQGELDKLRGQLLTQLGILDMDTGYRADRAFMEALYPPGHPYARPSLGNRETLRAFGIENTRRFYQTYYHPATLKIAVVGAIQVSQVIDRLAATLGQWRVEGPVHPWQVPPAETPGQAIARRIELPAKSQVDLIWGVVGMPRTSPDYYPAAVANLVLGRLGMMGRLGERVRDTQGLAYYVTSSLQANPGPHPWNIAAGVQPRHVDQAVASILEELARLRDELISDQEMEDSRSYLTGALPLRLETNEGIADLLLNIEEYNLGLDYLQRYPQIIGAVTREAIQRVVRQYLTLDRYVLTMAGTFG